MTPNGWRFLVGLPTTIDEWKTCKLNPSKFDYFRGAEGSEKRFEQVYGRPVRDSLCLLKKLGCAVSRCSLNKLGDSITGAEVITLIGHWNKHDHLELADGLHDWRIVVNAIPEDYSGVIDLCVCHPEPMVRYLDVHRKKALVKYKSLEPSQIVLWLGIYGVMAAQMKEHPLSFTDALVFAVRKLGLP